MAREEDGSAAALFENLKGIVVTNMYSRLTQTVVLVTLAALLGLSGCGNMIFSSGQKAYPDSNEVPIASNFQTSHQLKLQAAEHWRKVSNTSAESLIKAIGTGAVCIPKTGCTTLYVRRNCETSGCKHFACDNVFNRVFFNDFVTALVNLGYPVSEVPTANSITVDIDIQTVSFAANRPQFRYAGETVELGKGIWALKDVASLYDQQGNLTPRTNGEYSFNWFRTEFAAGETPRNELVVTVSAMSPERTYLARNTGLSLIHI